MRKILLATSALVAGSAVAASASAAEAPTVTLSGGIDIVYLSESVDSGEGANRDSLDFTPGSTDLEWDINAEADNGLAYGGRIDWRPLSGVDEIWIDMSGSFGTVVLGQDDGVGDNTVPHAGSALVGSYGFDGSFVGGTSGSTGDVGSARIYGPAHGTSDSAKVSYYTPSFGGFSAGISFTPDDNSGNGSSTTTADLSSGEVSTSTPDTYDNHVELMAAFSGELAGADLTVAAQYQTAEAAVATNEDVEIFEIGATVGIAGFTVAAGYVDNGDSLEAQNSRSDSGTAFDIGVGYSFGATAVSVGYLVSERADANGQDDEYENLAFDVEYTIAEGLSTYAGVQFAESEDASATGASRDADSTLVVIGTRLSF